MAVTYKTYGAGANTGATVDTALTVAAGDAIIVFATAVYSVLPTLSISDGVNSWSTAVGPVTNAGSAMTGYAFVCGNAATSATLTITVTASTGTPSLRTVAVLVSGQDQTTPVGSPTSGTFTADSSPQATGFTPTAAGLGLAFFGISSSFTFSAWDAGWDTILAGSRTMTGKVTTTAGNTYTPGVTFVDAESGVIMGLNISEAGAPGDPPLTAYAYELEGE